MPHSPSPRVAVLGAGEIGRGWAALCAGAGWQVAIYDADSAALTAAAAAIGERAERLVQLGRAEREIVSNALHALRVGRSLLHAVSDADWIIDTLPEEAATHPRFLEQVEQVARRATVLTSCVATLHASELAARLRRPDRLLALHVTAPVELMPLVEVIPGRLTDPVCAEDVRYWLLALGRVPVMLERELPGHVVERIAAAVWRECAHLLSEGVIGARDLDRAIALGLALGWTVTGPVNAVASAGDESAVAARLHQLQALWPHLSAAHGLDGEELHRLVRAIERAFPTDAPALRDERLARLLDARGPDPA